jgi:hypothetical protein
MIEKLFIQISQPIMTVTLLFLHISHRNVHKICSVLSQDSSNVLISLKSLSNVLWLHIIKCFSFDNNPVRLNSQIRTAMGLVVWRKKIAQNFTVLEFHGYVYQSFSGWTNGQRTGGHRFHGGNMGPQQLINGTLRYSLWMVLNFTH